jgi:hypothetical protein
LAFWTASIESVRIVLMHSSSSLGASDLRAGVLKRFDLPSRILLRGSAAHRVCSRDEVRTNGRIPLAAIFDRESPGEVS